MLEKPDIPDDRIIAAVQAEYGLNATDLSFLPLGVDVNTAVYRFRAPRINIPSPGAAEAAALYFLKLRKGKFDELSVSVPRFLSQSGIEAIIPPLSAQDGGQRARMGEYMLILYPFIAGRDGYEQPLSDAQWIAFGRAMHSIHSADLPPEEKMRIATEVYNPLGRERVAAFQAQVTEGAGAFDDPVAEKLAVFMRAHQAQISRMVRRGDQLAHALCERALPFVLCHADIHLGNILLAEDGRLFIVDWDQPMLAPKERDLVLIGGGSSSLMRPSQEEILFYQGYGAVEVDRMALSYFRYERIIQDIAEFCQALLATSEGGEDREQSYRYFTGQFQPGRDVETAFKTDEGE